VAQLAITIDMPPTGELEITGDGTSPTQAQMDEEMQARDDFLDLVSPFLKSLPERHLQRAGNVSHVQLLGRNVWSELNHYLVLITVDIGGQNIAGQLAEILPQGAQVSLTGDLNSLREWPEAPASS
jgi:hypothetical protein